MSRMLEELYYGSIDPNAKHFIRSSSYEEALRTISDSEEKLTGLLEGKEKVLLLKLLNA